MEGGAPESVSQLLNGEFNGHSAYQTVERPRPPRETALSNRPNFLIQLRETPPQDRPLVRSFDLMLLQPPIERAAAEAECFCGKKRVPLISG